MTHHVMKTRAACAAIYSLVASLTFSQDREPNVTDFSTTNSITLLLADTPRGKRVRGQQGLEHDFWQSDGITTVENVEGVACRNVNLTKEGYNKGYLYFVIDPTFKT